MHPPSLDLASLRTLESFAIVVIVVVAVLAVAAVVVLRVVGFVMIMMVVVAVSAVAGGNTPAYSVQGIVHSCQWQNIHNCLDLPSLQPRCIRLD